MAAADKALKLTNGRVSRIADAGTLEVGQTLLSSTGNLTLSAAGTDVVVAAGKNLSSASGAGAVDFSAASGLFKTSTGTVTIGPGAVGVSGAATFSAAGTALTVTNDAAVGGNLVITGNATATVAILAETTAPSATAGFGKLYVKSSDSKLYFKDDGGTEFDLTATGTLTGSGTADQVAFFSSSTVLTSESNLFWDSANNRLGINNASPAVALHVNGAATVSGEIAADGGIGRSSAGTLSIGTDADTTGLNIATGSASGAVSFGTATGVTSITIGRSGMTTTVAGDLAVTGAETVSGTSTFQANATFEGDVTFGNAATDTVAFISRLGTSGNPNLNFLKEVNHTITIDASTTTDTAGANLTITAANGVGTGVGGNLTLNAGNGSTDGTISIGTGNVSAITMGQSGVTTTVDGPLTVTDNFTQSAGTVSVTGNGASSITTSSGALTLTSAAAATWSTAAGALSLSGFSVLNLQSNGTTAMQVASGTSVVVQAGAVLSTTGSGNINLPNNGSARFQIEGSAVGSTVTATNLNTLTNGSNADALHTHSGLGAEIAATAGATLAAGNVVSFDDSGGNPRVLLADANGAGELVNAVGIAVAAATSGNAVSVKVAGEIAIPDALWDSVPGTGDVGKRVYMSETAGNLTLTEPSTAGSTVLRIGIVTVGGTGAVKIAVQIGEGVVI